MQPKRNEIILALKKEQELNDREKSRKRKKEKKGEVKDETIYRGVVKCCSGNGLLRTGGPQATAF